MHSFRDYYVINEVKASKANIAQFIKKYTEDDIEDYVASLGYDEFSSEDERKVIIDLFDRFTKQVSRGKLQQKDIFGFQSLDDLVRQIETAEATKSASELKQIEKAGAVRVYENDTAMVIHPKTHDASCHYGAGAQWCTAARDDRQFKDYTQKQGVVLLYFLPKGGQFDSGKAQPKPQPVKKSPSDDKTVDTLIMMWPDVFETYTQESKSVAKYIKAAYMNGRPSEPLDTIASWSTENADAVTRARKTMVSMINAWNERGEEFVRHHLGTLNEDGLENGEAKDNLIYQAMQEGLMAMLHTSWADVAPHRHEYPATDIEEYRVLYPLMKQLRDNPNMITGNSTTGQDSSRAYDKLALAVYPMDVDQDYVPDNPELGQEINRFGPYTAEGFDAQDEPIEPASVIAMAGLSEADVNKISQYIKQFAVDKVWEDKDPAKVYEYITSNYSALGNQGGPNATPENINKADAFFLNEPKATYNQYAWKYATVIKKDGWPELEKLFLNELDVAAKTGKELINWRKKQATWDGFKELESHVEDLEREMGQPIYGTPNDWLKGQYNKYEERYQQPLERFLKSASGLLGYLFKVKGYDWPELEKRILNPDYYMTGVTHLGPDWVRHGRSGERWKEFEETLYKLWDYTTKNPYVKKTGSEDIGNALTNDREFWEKEQEKENVAEHNKTYGSVEDVSEIIRATKSAYGGGTGGSEEIAFKEAEDAWWNLPEIVADYWGHGSIIRKQTPSEKKRGKAAKKWFVTDKMVPRPFFHEVKPGAYLPGVPNPLTISTSHADPQYVGKKPGEVEQTIGQMIDRHDGKRYGESYKYFNKMNSKQHKTENDLISEAYNQVLNEGAFGGPGGNPDKEGWGVETSDQDEEYEYVRGIINNHMQQTGYPSTDEGWDELFNSVYDDPDVREHHSDILSELINQMRQEKR